VTPGNEEPSDTKLPAAQEAEPCPAAPADTQRTETALTGTVAQPDSETAAVPALRDQLQLEMQLPGFTVKATTADELPGTNHPGDEAAKLISEGETVMPVMEVAARLMGRSMPAAGSFCADAGIATEAIAVKTIAPATTRAKADELCLIPLFMRNAAPRYWAEIVYCTTAPVMVPVV
jgi:hypothetical protein